MAEDPRTGEAPRSVEEAVFDLAALEEGQEPLEPAPLPLLGFPAPPVRLPPEDAPPGSDWYEEESASRDDPETRASGESEPGHLRLRIQSTPSSGDLQIRNLARRAESAALGEAATPPPAPPVPAPAVPSAPAPPFEAEGLSPVEVRDRVERGLSNLDKREERSNWDIVRENTLTFFNLVLFTLIAALFVLAAVEQEINFFQDGIFVGIVVAANVAIGTVQEIRATNMLREIVALSTPRAHVIRGGEEGEVLAEQVVQDDLLHIGPGDQVVADGHIVADGCELDESLLTGESSSVRKGPGDTILSGSFCTAGSAYYQADKVGPESYAMRLSADARKLVKRETPLQLRFRRILRLLLIATAILGALLLISSGVSNADFGQTLTNTTATITSVVPEGLLLGMTVAFGAGAVRVSRAGAIVQEINAVEALNYIDVVCLDKTGTITANALSVERMHWAGGREGDRAWLGAFARHAADESRTAGALAAAVADDANAAGVVERVPFNSERRWSALSLELGTERRHFVLGAPESVLQFSNGAEAFEEIYGKAAARGLRGVAFAEANTLPDPERGIIEPLRPVALITIGDVLRDEVGIAFDTMAELGVEPKIISGDNPGTVAALVQQLGITIKGGVVSGSELAALNELEFSRAVEENSIFGRIAPDQKQRIIQVLKANNHYVAMVGDGANDVRALRESDVAVAMESGTGTARAVSGIVLRNDSFEAFVRATAVAQSVLGNSSQLTKLFITKSFYAYLLIVASEMLGLEFPFLPRHGSLTALFTLGIPTIFISLTTPPPSAGRDFTNSVLRFAVPASLALAAAAVTVHLLTEGFLDRPLKDSQTLVALVIGIVGLFYMVQVIGFEGVTRGHIGVRPVLTTIFGALLLVLFILVLYAPPLRRFFDFTSPGIDEWAIVLPAVVAAMVGQYVISHRWREIVQWVMRDPGGGEAPRGRQI